MITGCRVLCMWQIFFSNILRGPNQLWARVPIDLNAALSWSSVSKEVGQLLNEDLHGLGYAFFVCSAFKLSILPAFRCRGKWPALREQSSTRTGRHPPIRASNLVEACPTFSMSIMSIILMVRLYHVYHVPMGACDLAVTARKTTSFNCLESGTWLLHLSFECRQQSVVYLLYKACQSKRKTRGNKQKTRTGLIDWIIFKFGNEWL